MDGGLGQNRLLNEIQQGLAEQDLRTDSHQNVPPDGQAITTASSRIAESLIPRLTQVVSGALAEAVSTGARTGHRIRQIVVRHGLRWSLPPELVPQIQMFVLKYLDLVAQRRSEIEQFLKRFGPGVRPSICYQVYHHGRTDYYYDELPKEVLDIRNSVLF